MEMVAPPTLTTYQLFLGSSFHLAIMMYQKSRLAGIELSEQEVMEVFCDLWRRRVGAQGRDIYWGKVSEANQQQLGLDMLHAYFPYAKEAQPEMVEEHAKKLVTLQNGEVVEVYGTIDLVTKSLVMVDYKTAAWAPYRSEIERSLQPTVYQFLADTVCPFEFHYIMKQKVPEIKIYPVVKTEYDLDFFQFHLLPYCVAMIKSGMYPPFGFVNAECRWCPRDGKCGE
jgi:hypothetical protein